MADSRGGLNGYKAPLAGGTVAALLATGGGWLWQDVTRISAEMAVNRSMILNLSHRTDALELKIESVRVAPTGISAETRPRLEMLDQEVRDIRSRLRELERRRQP